jgi:alkylation response protein AidB-like acyl-CoA dehydrogenase
VEQSPSASASEHAVANVVEGNLKSRTWDDHRLTADQLQFRSLASDFAENELLPFAAQWDEQKHFPVEVFRKAAKLGFGGIFCGHDVGGSSLTRADGAVIFEALAYADVSTTAYLTIHNMCASLIERFGTEEQRQEFLPELTSMELLSSYCLTEPNSGSDAASLQTTAKRKEGSTDYVLNGEKAFISGGGVSDVYLVMARTGEPGPKGISCFLVEKDTKGLSFGRQEDKLGWRSQPTSSVILEDVKVPERNLIGKEGEGFTIAMSALDGGRINIATCSVGGAQFCVDAAQGYVSSRKQFGKAIIDFQNTQFKLADMLTSVQASRFMVANAATALDSKSPWASASAAMAKRFATDECYLVANDALQLHGGYGYLKDYAVERYVRDLRVHTILEGTNEIMRVVMARHMIKSQI